MASVRILPGLYWWVRDIDETGMSGTGRVAQVAVFEDGSAVLRWIKALNSAGVASTVMYESVLDLLWVHGHGEKRTGHLETAFVQGQIVFADCNDERRKWIPELKGKIRGSARITEVRDSPGSHYAIKLERGGPESDFWAYDTEVFRGQDIHDIIRLPQTT